jgi:hypothetical protein
MTYLSIGIITGSHRIVTVVDVAFSDTIFGDSRGGSVVVVVVEVVGGGATPGASVVTVA